MDRTRTAAVRSRARAEYETEKALARRLREAPAEERGRLYGEIYDEVLRHSVLRRVGGEEPLRALEQVVVMAVKRGTGGK